MNTRRNKCAEELILHMVINEGLTVTVQPCPLHNNAVEFKLSKNGRHCSTVIDQSLRDKDMERHHDMTCHAIAECYYHLLSDPIDQILYKERNGD